MSIIFLILLYLPVAWNIVSVDMIGRYVQNMSVIFQSILVGFDINDLSALYLIE